VTRPREYPVWGLFEAPLYIDPRAVLFQDEDWVLTPGFAYPRSRLLSLGSEAEMKRLSQACSGEWEAHAKRLGFVRGGDAFQNMRGAARVWRLAGEAVKASVVPGYTPRGA
jgi:hypothetical protein